MWRLTFPAVTFTCSPLSKVLHPVAPCLREGAVVQQQHIQLLSVASGMLTRLVGLQRRTAMRPLC